MKTRKEITNLTITAVFIALLFIQTFVPNVGYVRILPSLPAITTIPLTIAVYGTLMGPKWGIGFWISLGNYSFSCGLYTTRGYGQLAFVPKSSNLSCS